MFVREKMKKQRESMVMNVSAEEMPAQLRKAAKSVRVTFLMSHYNFITIQIDSYFLGF